VSSAVGDREVGVVELVAKEEGLSDAVLRIEAQAIGVLRRLVEGRLVEGLAVHVGRHPDVRETRVGGHSLRTYSKFAVTRVAPPGQVRAGLMARIEPSPTSR
jgi:hypothetical protein